MIHNIQSNKSQHWQRWCISSFFSCVCYREIAFPAVRFFNVGHQRQQGPCLDTSVSRRNLWTIDSEKLSTSESREVSREIMKNTHAAGKHTNLGLSGVKAFFPVDLEHKKKQNRDCCNKVRVTRIQLRDDELLPPASKKESTKDTRQRTKATRESMNITPEEQADLKNIVDTERKQAAAKDPPKNKTLTRINHSNNQTRSLTTWILIFALHTKKC